METELQVELQVENINNRKAQKPSLKLFHPFKLITEIFIYYTDQR